MSAREEAVEMIRRICPPHLSADEYGQILAEKFDAHRAEILAEAKVETVNWLVKKTSEHRARGPQYAKQADVISSLASKIDRGAVRAFIGTAHYRDALDAHRAEVLAEDGQAYPGELAMLTGLVATLHAFAEHGDLDDVRKLLAEHKRDDAEARAQVGEKATATEAAPATPGFFQPGHLYAFDHYRFLCEYLATHPAHDGTSAWGWFGRDGAWRHMSFSRRQYEVRQWVDVTATEATDA